MGMSLMFYGRKETVVSCVVTRSKVQRGEIKEQITQSLLAIRSSADLMGSHQKIVGTRKNALGYQFRTISMDASMWAGSRE